MSSWMLLPSTQHRQTKENASRFSMRPKWQPNHQPLLSLSTKKNSCTFLTCVSWKIKSARPLSLKGHRSISSQENVNKKVESGMTFPDFFDRMKLKKTLSNKRGLVMKHLFKLIILFPWFYFFSWIEKANRDSKFFPIFYYFYWFYIPLYALFSLAWTVISVLFFNIVLRNVTDIKLWGIWFLFILLAISMNRLTYFCFKKMFRLRRELGKSKAGRH